MKRLIASSMLVSFCAMSMNTPSHNLVTPNYTCCEQSPLLKSTVGRLIDFNKNVFWSESTLGVVVFGAPLYTIARMYDKPVHNCFYCTDHHRNVRQCPDSVYKAMNAGLGIMMGSLSLLSLLPNDSNLRRTSRLYALSLPYTWGIKNLLKQIHHNGCIRPKNQHFCKTKTYYGGCPSGHAMEVWYSAMLYTLQGGPAFAVPLWLFTGFVSLELINCNRHYSSQVVAGAGLGLIFAFAANKTLNDTNKQWYSVVKDEKGLALRAQYNF